MLSAMAAQPSSKSPAFAPSPGRLGPKSTASGAQHGGAVDGVRGARGAWVHGLGDLATGHAAVAQAGRAVFALAVVGFGAHHLVAGGFATRGIPAWPLPGSATAWALLVGAFLVVGGLSILADWRRRPFALGLAALWSLVLLVVLAPRVVANWRVAAVWTNPGKNLVFATGALLVAACASAGSGALTQRAWTLARLVLGAFLVLCGVEHFVYTTFAAALVPRWIPGPTFCVLAAGVALIGCGLGLVVGGRAARVAGLFAGAMIASWFLILHIPRALSAWSDPGEWSGVCESLAIAGIAWLVSGTNAALPSSLHTEVNS